MSEATPSNTLFVSCTQKSNSAFTDTLLGDSLERLEHLYQDEIFKKIFYKNTRGLSECYNQAISYANTCDFEYIVFVHDDVAINDMYLFEKLSTSFKNFDIVGVAGTSTFNLVPPPQLNFWFKNTDPTKSGIMYHTRKDSGDDITNVYPSVFGMPGKKCKTLDGVFFAVKLSDIRDNGIRFDERFTFDFYDLDFCLSAHKRGLALGTSNIMITHASHGSGVNGERFRALNSVFYEKHK